jgi:uncharacterized protein (TIGR02600 family)
MRRRISHQSSGMALVLVLGAILLLTVLVVAFLASTKTERTAAHSQLNQTEARLLSENVLSLVTAQIREATTQTNTAWASQPGLIRTYSSGGNKTYKLYSAEEMIATNFDPAAGTDVPANWSTRLDQFVDLNSPATVTSTLKKYPILDPGLAWNAAGSTGIKGFLNNSATNNMVASGTNANPLPMPVRWLYVLQDGTLQAMNSSGKVSSASATNPIVGRVAFWADDEACKININTASQGTYWDVPRGNGNDYEKGSFSTGYTVNRTGLGVGQPLQGEFQRYPGHPATTSLGVIFDAKDATGNSLFWPSVSGSTMAVASARRELIYGVIPRVNGGGSQGGTVCPDPTNPATSRLFPDKDRLYASVDELAFSGTFTGTDRTANISSSSTNSGLSIDTIQKLNFFLTANSRAPEVTVFNTPRMTIWPIDKDPAKRTVLDKAINFCSTLTNASTGAKTELIFTRTSLDPGELKNVNNGSTPASGSLSQSVDFNTNNKKLYTYLQNLTSKDIPGFGSKSFAAKLDDDRDQVLTEIFDYIRCTNLFNNSTTGSSPFTGRPWIRSINPFWSTTQYNNYVINPTQPIIGAGNDKGYYGPSLFFGQVVPLQINTTKGFGRFAHITGAALVFFGREPAAATDKYIDGNPANTAGANLKPYKRPGKTGGQPIDGLVTCTPANVMQAMLILTYATPSAGTVDYHHRCDYRITGLDSLKVNGNPAGFPSSATEKRFSASSRGDVFSAQGGSPEWWLLGYVNGSASASTTYGVASKTSATPGSDAYYPFISAPIPFTPTISGGVDVGTFTFSADEISIDSMVGGQVVQTTKIKFPDFTAPNPMWTNTGGNGSPVYDRPEGRAVSNLGGNDTWPSLILNHPQADVVRMMELRGGDIRMVAGRQTVSKDFFVPHKDYNTSTIKQAQSLWRHPMGSFGSLVSSAPNDPYNAIASNLNGVTGAGDWDIGTPVTSVYAGVGTPCGGFINKADDSGSGYVNQYGSPSAPYFEQNSCIVSADRCFSPNRMVPSAVMFGSLPTGVARHDPLNNDKSWQTLLFRPNGQTAGTHPGSASPPDHLLLDLFNMPVVEPYPISEPFSSAGKINMNYQIAPFTYITRDTGMRAALDAIRITAIPTSNPYLRIFGPTSNSNTSSTNYRYPIDPDSTLALFADRFANNNPFKSASEICDMFLIPKPENKPSPAAPEAPSINPYQTQPPANATAAQALSYVQTFWQSATGGAGTADNLRERPYAALYPRLTTKSNTYTVHLRVQSLKKIRGSDPQTFDQTKETVKSEYRGSFIIERFLDPNASTFDITAPTSTLGPYKFRVVNTKQFNP